MMRGRVGAEEMSWGEVRPFQGVKVTLEQTMKAQRGSQGIRLLLNFGARWGWVVNDTPRPLYPRERDPVPIV